MTSSTSPPTFGPVLSCECDSVVVDVLDAECSGTTTTTAEISVYRLQLLLGSRSSVTVELCALGASLTRLIVPNTTPGVGAEDDLVLGYDSVADLYTTQNPHYLSGVTIGRVANRIRNGQWVLPGSAENDFVPSWLDCNEHDDEDGRNNHLHGGIQGFSRRIWDSECVTDDDGATTGVQFRLRSPDGDQGYPGTLEVTTTYTLHPTPSPHSVRLSVEWQAELLSIMSSSTSTTTTTPINLTNHSYWNLAGHASPNGILDHQLYLYCRSYTPVLATEGRDAHLPTRQVQPVSEVPCFDFSVAHRRRRTLRDALLEYETFHRHGSPEPVPADLVGDRSIPLPKGTSPYGFDHNYVVSRGHGTSDSSDNNNNKDENDLALVAVLQHPASGRRLTVRSTQPGVQLYTGNGLDSLDSTPMKDGTRYHRWQGLCLETQHYPDSLHVDASQFPDFALGQCPVLTLQQPRYRQQVEYTLEWVEDHDKNTATVADVDDTIHNNLETLLWSDREEWYQRAAEHYEEHCPPTIDGVLGGYAAISDIDLDGSRQFLRDLQVIRPAIRSWATGRHGRSSRDLQSRDKNESYRACECGAGLGRVTKGLLLDEEAGTMNLSRCDLVESSTRLLAAAPAYLGDAVASRCRFFAVRLHEWEPPPQTYTVIWIQWVLSYLTDRDIVQFLGRCGKALVDTPGALIVLKENVCSSSADDEYSYEVDDQDASVTRSLLYWKHLIRQAGLRVVYEKWQHGLPNDIFAVPMLALEVVPS